MEPPQSPAGPYTPEEGSVSRSCFWGRTKLTKGKGVAQQQGVQLTTATLLRSTPMAKLSLLTWIGNAAAVLCGQRGDVTRQAHQAGCSRQTAYQHAHKVHQAVADSCAGGPSYAALLDEVRQLREENRQLWEALEPTIDLATTKQQRFAVTAAALGLSDRQIATLLALLLGARAPSRATVGRWVLAGARRAGVLLHTLDRLCQMLVLTVCLDEIFCRRRPVLVGVEPHSMACVLARRAPDRSGQTWAAALQPFGALHQVICDAGSGLRKGLELYQQRRACPAAPGAAAAQAAPALALCLDLFHTCQEAQRVLRLTWRAAEAVWRRWDAKQHTLDHLNWRGVPRWSPEHRRASRQAEKAHSKAKQVLQQAERQEQAWQRARAAFELVRPDGSVNDRAAATADIRAALAELKGPRWSKVRNFLTDSRSLTFLDILQQALAAAEPRAEVRAALVSLWQVRQLQRPAGGREPSATLAVAECVQQRVCQQLAADWLGGYTRVAAVLRQVVRASSVVECMNSIWRMHQARHRGLSQELLDLKRLWWNCRAFGEGKRRGRCPYQLLGLKLPTYDAWELLQWDPEQLAQQLSTSELAA